VLSPLRTSFSEAWKGPRRRQGTIPTVSTSSGTDGSNPAPSSEESAANSVRNLEATGYPIANLDPRPELSLELPKQHLISGGHPLG
jgi:hypothetical protein